MSCFWRSHNILKESTRSFSFRGLQLLPTQKCEHFCTVTIPSSTSFWKWTGKLIEQEHNCFPPEPKAHLAAQQIWALHTHLGFYGYMHLYHCILWCSLIWTEQHYWRDDINTVHPFQVVLALIIPYLSTWLVKMYMHAQTQTHRYSSYQESALSFLSISGYCLQTGLLRVMTFYIICLHGGFIFLHWAYFAAPRFPSDDLIFSTPDPLFWLVFCKLQSYWWKYLHSCWIFLVEGGRMKQIITTREIK